MAASLGGGKAAVAYPAVPREGLSLAALREFTAAHAGRSLSVSAGTDLSAASTTLRFEQLTTAQVVEAIVKPATLRALDNGGRSCSYAQLLLAQVRLVVWLRTHCVRARAEVGCLCGVLCKQRKPDTHVGFATRFVSHAWSYPFVDLLAALDVQPGGGPDDAYYWIGAARTFRTSAINPLCAASMLS
jgi:non-ribosomal peptide synthetase component F